MKEFCMFLLAGAAACAVLPAVAEDFAFTYRGRITARGTLPAELSVTYSLYEEENASTPVWTQTKTEFPAANGAFQSVLSGDGLQAAFEDQKARFLGLRLGGPDAPEQFPRQEILAIPLAGCADVVEGAPAANAAFVNAEVGSLAADTFTAGSLVVTNHLAVSGGSLSLPRVEIGEGAKLTIRKEWNSSVVLFGGPPMTATFDENRIIYQDTELFGGASTRGGLLVLTTTDPDMWGEDYTAQCVTVPVGPGVVKMPVNFQGPAAVYFYEFGK